MPGPIIIFGSSRSRGETWKAIQAVIDNKTIPIIDLNEFAISPFDYDHRNKSDDFIPLMEKVINHDPIILATPVYWYTMSAQMKIFIDRCADLLKIRKDLGRALQGKTLFVIASYGTSLPRGFEDAFDQSCEYMDMKYGGCCYYYTGKDPDLLNTNPGQVEICRKKLFGV